MRKFITAVPSRTKKINVINHRKEDHSTKNNFKSSEQLFIDFGQKSFGATLNCSSCGMLFVIGDKVDETKHEAYCKSLCTLPSLSSFKGFENIGKGSNEKDCILLQRSITISISTVQGLRDIFTIMIADLGLSSDFLCRIKKDIVILLYCRLKAIIGCILVEEVSMESTLKSMSSASVIKKESKVADDYEKENFQPFERELKRQKNDHSAIYLDCSKHDTGKSPSTTTSTPNKEDQEFSADSGSTLAIHDSVTTSSSDYDDDGDVSNRGSVVGIRALWVHKEYRRQRVGCQLLDSARQHLSFGRVFPRRMVAICDPTNEGAAFITRYLDNEGPVLVYTPEE